MKRKRPNPLAPETVVNPLPRGLYRVPYLSPKGYPLLCAVDSRNRVIRVKACRPNEMLEGARQLTALLELLDPPPT